MRPEEGLLVAITDRREIEFDLQAVRLVLRRVLRKPSGCRPLRRPRCMAIQLTL